MALTEESGGGIPATMLVGPTGYGGGMPYPVYGGEDGGSSYRRGRGRNARRDSRGRYDRDGESMYYRDSGELAQQIEELMEDAPNEQVKQRMRQLMQDLQQM